MEGDVEDVWVGVEGFLGAVTCREGREGEKKKKRKLELLDLDCCGIGESGEIL